MCLLGAASLAMEVMKPLYHHPVYNLPVYSSQPYAALQNPAVTTYGNGPADPGTYFWVDICHIPHRKIAALFTAFDTDCNGIISFPGSPMTADPGTSSALESTGPPFF